MLTADPKTQGYRKLIVYQKSLDLVLLTYKLTKKLPKEEIYILLPQIKRAVISVVANIVEGYSKSVGTCTLKLKFWLKWKTQMQK